MKQCPKCGESVSCKNWRYCDKMCSRCSGRRRYKKNKLLQQAQTKKLKKTKNKK